MDDYEYKEITDGEIFDKISDGHRIANLLFKGQASKYYIRSDGKFFSVRRHATKIKERVQIVNHFGYKVVTVSIKQHLRIKSVHRMVALAFIENKRNLPFVNHLDGDKCNNDITNLEWCTASENIRHAVKHGLINPRSLENSPLAKCTNSQIREVCRLLEKNEDTMDDISRMTGVPKTTILNIKSGSWKNISCMYKISNYNIQKTNNGNLRLTSEIANKICADIASGKMSMREISDKYNIPYSRVNDIKQRKTWNSISKNYDFSNYNYMM